MSNYDKIYKKLRTQYTDEEIADSMMIPADLTPEEQEEANKELKAFRFKLLAEMTQEQRVYSDLLRLRYQIENYIHKMEYDSSMDFGTQLEEYIRILNKTKKKVAEELGIHYTRLSRVINNRETPNVEFIYRLEEHSGRLVPALVWWKLLIKKQEFQLLSDNTTRKIEAAKVQPAVVYKT
ncbi:MAG: plasmid maintenance system antidote protein VapI [Flammeovirgaceae bacterium]|jgi:plasmid maintenance system antidote protein VapI